MQLNNLYLAEINIIDKDSLLHTEYRLVWATSESDAVEEVKWFFGNEENEPIGEISNVTITPAIGKMVR